MFSARFVSQDNKGERDVSETMSSYANRQSPLVVTTSGPPVPFLATCLLPRAFILSHLSRWKKIIKKSERDGLHFAGGQTLRQITCEATLALEFRSRNALD